MPLITPAVLSALRTEVRRQFHDAFDAMKATTFWTDVAMLAPSSPASSVAMMRPHSSPISALPVAS